MNAEFEEADELRFYRCPAHASRPAVSGWFTRTAGRQIVEPHASGICNHSLPTGPPLMLVAFLLCVMQREQVATTPCVEGVLS